MQQQELLGRAPCLMHGWEGWGAAFPLTDSLCSPGCSLPAARRVRGRCLCSPTTAALRGRAQRQSPETRMMLPACCPSSPPPVQPICPWDWILLCLEDSIPLPFCPPAASPASPTGQHGHIVQAQVPLLELAAGGMSPAPIWLVDPLLLTVSHGECAHAAWSKARAP